MKKLLSIISVSFILILAACGGGDDNEGAGSIETIKFADAGWDSIKVHNHIAQTIIEEGYGYSTEVVTGSTPVTFTSHREGDIQVYMEVWTDNIKEAYQEAMDEGDIVEVSTNFDDNVQGLFVPTYVIEGDPERGIEPVAPDLKTVKDLAKYADVFQDPEDPNKGRIVGAPTGWAVDEILSTKVETYGLDEHYNYISPGSDSALVSSLAAAYKDGKPWVGYYWSPTWVTALYDLTILEDEPYDPEIWEKNRGTEFPPNKVTVTVHKDLPEQAPEVVDFLENYKTSTELTEEALKYLQENETSTEEAAIWWLKQYQDVWTQWVPEDVAEKVKSAL
ncbi:MAG: ABC transporter substrate-binding protein [Bacillaceae bacterium]|nr:ABC transporter substrate-binding protein [Bacillaceae bacterium]